MGHDHNIGTLASTDVLNELRGPSSAKSKGVELEPCVDLTSLT